MILWSGCRTLDLMHIASALLLGAGGFVSTDKRQCHAAKLCGLRISVPGSGKANR